MDYKMIITYALTGISILVTLWTTWKDIRKAIRERDWKELTELLTKEIVPLMEQAERKISDGEEKETWVVQKLSEKLHIDFFKYRNILMLAKEIISNICKTTKIEVNKNFITQEEKTEQKESATNGIS